MKFMIIGTSANLLCTTLSFHPLTKKYCICKLHSSFVLALWDSEDFVKSMKPLASQLIASLIILIKFNYSN